MKLISFDVGIKNMAYCILDLQGTQLNISNWGILNLMDDENISYTCDCKNKQKIRKHHLRTVVKRQNTIKITNITVKNTQKNVLNI